VFMRARHCCGIFLLHPGFMKPSHRAYKPPEKGFKAREPCRDSLFKPEEISPRTQGTGQGGCFFRG
jgi:hypothetical protein